MPGTDQGAAELADSMLADTDTMRTIIEETLQSAEDGKITESGRTVCNGTEIHGPESRRPTSVSLFVCPHERGGSWHTHVTPGHLRDPYNSLPDVANVLWGNVDVIVVAGTETAEAAVRPQDVAAAREEFLGVVGAPNADGPGDVSDAVRSGSTADPRAAATEFREQRPEMFVTATTDFPGLDQRIDRHVTPGLPASQPYSVAEATAHSAFYRQQTVIGDAFDTIEREAEEPAGRVAGAAMESIPADVKTVAVSNALGVFFGGLASRLVWGQ